MPGIRLEPRAELITVEATDGLQLPALLFEPATPTKRLVVWLHGMGSNGILFNTAHTNALAAAFTASGTAFLGLQNRGGGMLQTFRYFDETGTKQKRLQGTSHELIAECVHDINGAAAWAESNGYTELYVAGHSTGANKIALYNFLQPENPYAGYVLYGGGDDTGLFYTELGPKRHAAALAEARHHIAAGHGTDVAPTSLMDDHFSYQSIADILDPDSSYNTFPYYETVHGQLGTKPLWQEYESITKPMLVVYGELDPYALPDVPSALQMLKDHTSSPKTTTFKTVAGGDHTCYGHENELAAVIADWVNHAA